MFFFLEKLNFVVFVLFSNIVELFSIVVYIGGFFVIKYLILWFGKVCKIVGIDMVGGFK